jgi:hypothetical protein
MKYITHSIASTTWVALNRSRIFSLPEPLLLFLQLHRGDCADHADRLS